MGQQSKKKLSKSVATRLKSLYQRLHGEEMAEILFDCWESKRYLEDDPLSYKYTIQYSKGEISPRRAYDIIWAIVDADWHLWELTQAVDPFLRKEWRRKTGNPYPFESAIALFLATVEEMHSFSFYEQAIEQGRNYQASPRNLERFSDQVEQFVCFNLKPHQKRQKKKQALQHISRIPEFKSFSSDGWEEAFSRNCPTYFLVVEKGAKCKNETVRRRFEAWQRACVDSLKLQKPLLHSLKSIRVREGLNKGETVSIALQ